MKETVDGIVIVVDREDNAVAIHVTALRQVHTVLWTVVACSKSRQPVKSINLFFT